MGSRTAFLQNNRVEECDSPARDEDRQEFVEATVARNRASRGAFAGVLLGAGLWAVILIVAGVIKL